MKGEVSERPHSRKLFFSYKESAQSGFAQYAAITPLNPHVAQGITVLCKSDVYGVTVELSEESSNPRMTLEVTNGIERGKVSDTDDVGIAARSVTCRPILRFI